MCQSTFLFRQIKKAELSFYLMELATSNYALSMILTRRAVLSMMPQYYLWEIKKIKNMFVFRRKYGIVRPYKNLLTMDS